MKRILIIAVLAVLLLATVGATTAVAAKQKTVVTGTLYIGENKGLKAVGTATFDTTTGEWTITQKKAVPDSPQGYFVAVTTSSPFHHKYSEVIDISEAIPTDANGMLISTSGPIKSTTGVSDVNTCLANGGVFVLDPNSV